MIVRTYTRRNRGMPRICSDATLNDSDRDGFAEPFSQETHQDKPNFGLSSQESSLWSFDSDSFGSSQVSLPLVDPQRDDGRMAKKARMGCELPVDAAARVGWMGRSSPMAVAETATLMETQEFGEMMEHDDEVNFALDGLRKGQAVRIRRASLLSLLSICATAQQRRLLRTHGKAKTIVDAILGLNSDDSSSSLAAATLFFILTSDGQDDHILESPNYIQFLLKLLKPIISVSSKEKLPNIGHRLLALRGGANILQDRTKCLDSSSESIVHKVQEILVKSKELKFCNGSINGMVQPELSPKWIALLTMEKASLTTISLEEATGAMRKTGGSFKEKLRELGGLDAIFDVLLNCHSVLEGRSGLHSPFNPKTKDDANESLVLLLKSLKIMENATFLSKDNQTHLLRMRGNLDDRNSSSFTELIVSVIKILSGFFLCRSSANEEKDYSLSDRIDHTKKLTSIVDSQDGSEPAPRLGNSASNSEVSASSVDNCLLKMRANSSTSGSCSVASRSSNSEKEDIERGSKKNTRSSRKNTRGSTKNTRGSRKNTLGKKPSRSDLEEENGIIIPDDSEDPFEFDVNDCKPSKWELLSGKPNVERSHEMAGPDTLENETLNLLDDCLLTAVKVLMNLTNDNPTGCQQIAACGGLETMSSLIACHFPLFSSTCKTSEDNLLPPSAAGHLSEQQLDFLVAILGLLVNLVEKDSHNRSRLAVASVLFPGSGGVYVESRRDVIPLLCSIFLANRGAGEAAAEGNLSPGKVDAALSVGEREAEQTIIEAYAALLLAFLSAESKSIRGSIAARLPEHNVAVLVPVLDRFLAFHLTLDMISPETHRAVSEVIESCRVA